MTSGVGGDVTSLIPSNPEWNYITSLTQVEKKKKTTFSAELCCCCLEKNLLLPSVYPHCNGRHRCECDKMERHERKKGTCTMRWLSFRYNSLHVQGFLYLCACVCGYATHWIEVLMYLFVSRSKSNDSLCSMFPLCCRHDFFKKKVNTIAPSASAGSNATNVGNRNSY